MELVVEPRGLEPLTPCLQTEPDHTGQNARPWNGKDLTGQECPEVDTPSPTSPPGTTPTAKAVWG